MTDFERKVMEAARKRADVTIDRNVREDFEFDEHGLLDFARAIREIVVEECAKHFDAEPDRGLFGDTVAEELRELTKVEE